MQGARRRAVQRFLLGAVVAGGLIAVLVEVRAQLAPGEDAAVLAAHQALGDAVRGGDRSVARRLLSLQFTEVDENGKRYERKPFLDDLKSMAAPAAGGTVKVYGGIAVITGKRKSAQDSDVFFIGIWAKQRGAWRTLTMQEVVLGTAGSPQAVTMPSGAEVRVAEAKATKATETKATETKATETKAAECKNPCQTIPYRVRSPAEQDIVNAFQAIAKAVIAHDAGEYAKHMADEFVHYRSGYAPIPKAERIAIIEDQKERNIPAILTAIQSMRLWVYGDGAAMISTNGVPDDSKPTLRIARVWAKRNGQWQMVIGVQTEVK